MKIPNYRFLECLCPIKYSLSMSGKEKTESLEGSIVSTFVEGILLFIPVCLEVTHSRSQAANKGYRSHGESLSNIQSVEFRANIFEDLYIQMITNLQEFSKRLSFYISIAVKLTRSTCRFTMVTVHNLQVEKWSGPLMVRF